MGLALLSGIYSPRVFPPFLVISNAVNPDCRLPAAVWFCPTAAIHNFVGLRLFLQRGLRSTADALRWTSVEGWHHKEKDSACGLFDIRRDVKWISLNHSLLAPVRACQGPPFVRSLTTHDSWMRCGNRPYHAPVYKDIMMTGSGKIF